MTWNLVGRERVRSESGRADECKELLLLLPRLLKLKVWQQWCCCRCCWALLMDKRSAREERPAAITRLNLVRSLTVCLYCRFLFQFIVINVAYLYSSSRLPVWSSLQRKKTVRTWIHPQEKRGQNSTTDTTKTPPWREWLLAQVFIYFFWPKFSSPNFYVLVSDRPSPTNNSINLRV